MAFKHGPSKTVGTLRGSIPDGTHADGETCTQEGSRREATDIRVMSVKNEDSRATGVIQEQTLWH